MSNVFVQAVEALYGQDPESRKRADTWLTDFKNTSQAWQVISDVFKSSNKPEVIFIAADVALAKAKSEWRKLGSDITGPVLACVRCVAHASVSGFRSLRLVVKCCKLDAKLLMRMSRLCTTGWG